MIATRVSYRGFRNIADSTLTLEPGVNLLLGDNAQGKTNALEGILLMATGKSFRTPHERELVGFGADRFTLELDMRDSRRDRRLTFTAWSKESSRRRELTVGGAPVGRLAEFIGTFRAVLFCPEHLMLVKAGPGERRSFLDAALCQLRPVYLASLARHNKILTQRNALLKQLSDGVGEPALLEIYSEQLAREAAAIRRARQVYIAKLEREVVRFFNELGELGGASEVPGLVYKNSLKTPEPMSEAEAYEGYMKALTSNTAREIAAGATLWGSHKDDIEITLNGREARLYASQGQQRSLALAMKLGEGALSTEYTGEAPVFLFDDVLSELDPTRQRFLLSRLDAPQVIMTACSPPALVDGYNVVSVADGRFA